LAVRDLGVHYGQGYYLAKPAFSPPEVHWPAQLGRSVERPLSPARPPHESPRETTALRRSPTLPASPGPQAVISPRHLAPKARPVLIQEIVIAPHREEAHDRNIRASLRGKKPSPKTGGGPASRGGKARASKAPGSRPTKAPGSRGKASGSRTSKRPNATTARPSRPASPSADQRSPSKAPGRKTKPPR
jgi:hypothetical protein